MDEAEARQRLERMTAHDREPTLAVADVDDLVAMAKRPDADGLLPTDAGWTPTWELNAAAAAGWNWKAGKATADFDFSDDAGSYSRQQVFEMCKAQEDSYRKRAHGTIPLSRDELPWEVTA